MKTGWTRITRDKQIYKLWLKGNSITKIMEILWGTMDGKKLVIGHPFFKDETARKYIIKSIKRAKGRFKLEKSRKGK